MRRTRPPQRPYRPDGAGISRQQEAPVGTNGTSIYGSIDIRPGLNENDEVDVVQVVIRWAGVEDG
jgi:hypothetical protein